MLHRPVRLRHGGALALSLAAFAVTFLTRPSAQGGQPLAEPAPVVNQSDDPLLRSFRFRSIGPASMGGRIDDIAVSESDPNIIYVGTGEANNRQSSSFGAGVYKSIDGGKTFQEAGL